MIVRDRAVVLGGSLAGLLAAKVLAETTRDVVIVERDPITHSTGYRPGVSHGRHAHGLVAKGHQLLEQEFPGLTAKLALRGVEAGDFNGAIRWFFNGRELKPADSGLLSVPATRPVLEDLIRELVLATENIDVQDSTDIIRLETSGPLVTGAEVQSRENGLKYTIDADLVIDTTGRASRSPLWLHELGYDTPEREKVEIDLTYTTKHFDLPVDPFGDGIAIIAAATPESPRGAFFYRVPGHPGRVELSLTGMLGDAPPTDPQGFMEFVKTLPAPEIYEAVRHGEAVAPAVSFKYRANQRTRYERMSSHPGNFLVMGDAICSFNPIYAQGMTSTALQAQALREHTQNATVSPGHYFKTIARIVDDPWAVAVGSDLAYDGVVGNRTVADRFVAKYINMLHHGAVNDGALSNAFMRTAGLVSPPTSLFAPATVLRVLRAWAFAPAKKPPKPVPEREGELV